MNRRILSLVAASGIGLCNAPAFAQCQLWDLSGRSLILDQSNGIPAFFEIVQNGQELRGRASYFAFEEDSFFVGDKEDRVGDVEGMLTGSTAKFRVRWHERDWSETSIGVYELHIDDNGYVEGTTYDFEKPTSRANVLGRNNLHCADVAEAPPAPPPGPPSRVGAIGTATAAPPPTSIERIQGPAVSVTPPSPRVVEPVTVPVAEPPREPK